MSLNTTARLPRLLGMYRVRCIIGIKLFPVFCLASARGFGALKNDSSCHHTSWNRRSVAAWQLPFGASLVGTSVLGGD